jgi:hypothetical protein
MPKHLKEGWIAKLKRWLDAYTKRQLDKIDAYQRR